MKKTAFFLFGFCTLLFFSCDKKINRAIPVVAPCDFTEAQSVVSTNANATNLNKRKVLLEDYTGQFCGNCPKAAVKAEGMEKTYGDRLVVIANHVSDQFAKPQPAPDTLYQNDYRNEFSNYWDALLGPSKTGLPQGTVNRTQPWSIAYADWPARVDAALALPQSAQIIITSFYDTKQQLLKVRVKSTFLQAQPNANISLLVLVTADSLKGIQKRYTPPLPPPGAVIIHDDVQTNYTFNGMVLGSANGPQGQAIKSSPAVNDTATIQTPCFSLKRCFWQPEGKTCQKTVDDRYINVVAFLYNTTTYEVLQVERLSVMGVEGSH